MSDISGFGTVLVVKASNTFPDGFTITQASDDADFINAPNITIGSAAMGVNGNMVSWSSPSPKQFDISVVPNSEDDTNLKILAAANTVAANKLGANDVIQINIVYPDGKQTVMTGGKMTSVPPLNGISSAGRIKTNTYSFMFEKVVGG